MKIGMIIREAGYCTGNIKCIINKTPEDILLGANTFINIKSFRTKPLDYIQDMATIRTSDIIAIWKMP